ncbi:hypothetical protein EJ03DRAFT_276140, partial [Teratosphaeria nubilosa]
LPLKGNGASYYQDCLLKLVGFKLHELDPTLKPVLALDSDQLVMKNLDHLFVGLPDVDLAAPRAYWLSKDFLASTFLMINLSDRLWHTVESALATVQYNKFDMDLINDVLGETVMMLSGEYVTLNSHWEDWGLPSWYHASEGLNLTTHPFSQELSRPRDSAAVIHFTAAGKLWMHTPEHVLDMKPDAHPALAEQFELWRVTAADVCPGGIPGEKD